MLTLYEYGIHCSLEIKFKRIFISHKENINFDYIIFIPLIRWF